MTARKIRRILGWFMAFTLALLYVPLLAVAVLSFNSARRGYVWKGFTTQWYHELFQNEHILEMMRNTLILASVSTVIATVLGTLLAIGMSRFPWPKWFRGCLNFLVFLPVVTPDIIFGAAAIVVFGLLKGYLSIFQPGLFVMILAHVTFQISFVALVVNSRLASIGNAVQEAARDLYANTWQVFYRVLLPLLMPGIVSGAMLAFILSLDDFVISFFTYGPESTTLPIFIYASAKRGISPDILALSTLIFFITFLLVMGLELFTRYGKDKDHEKAKS